MKNRNASIFLKFALMVFSFLGLAASPTPKNSKPASASALTRKADPEIVEFLLASASKEFKSMEHGRPSGMRNCRIGHLNDSGKEIYFLSGSFKGGGETSAKWTIFTTIKTLDYEHWLGSAAESYARQKKVEWFSGEYSKEILKRLNN
ncbi:MAG: hypothetical protein IPN59_08940 [Holophaga sp.]|nr:hypothetical protein [Holophaga sp.]